MRRIAMIGVTLAVTACPQNQPPPPQCGFPSNFTPVDLVFGVAGQPLSVVLALDESCEDGVAVSAEVTVLDPDNLPVTLENPTRSVDSPNDQGVRTTLTFTPTRPGPHHVTARFQPNLGIVQNDVLVAANATLTAPSFSIPSTSRLSTCWQVDVTPDSKLLCLFPFVAVFEGNAGAQLQELDTDGAAHAQGALWLHHADGSISRWLEGTLADGGDGFIRSPDSTVSIDPGQATLLPTQRDLAVIKRDDGEVRLITLTDAGFTTAQPLGFMQGSFVALWRSGDSLLAASSGSSCGFSLATGPLPCFSNGGLQPIASDADGIWVATFNDQPFVGASSQLAVLNPSTPGTLDLPATYSASASSSGAYPLWNSSVMLSSNGQLLLPSHQASFSLTQWPLTGHVVSITHDWLTLDDGNGRLNIYRR